MSAHVHFGDDYAFSDIRAAVVTEDGSIVRTLNGVPMTPGTSLWLRTPLEAAAPELLAELENIANANPAKWDAEVRDQFREWAQSRARAAIAAIAAIAAATGETK